MSWTHKTLILPGALVIACSVINQFDDVGEILPDGGAGTMSGGSAGTDGGTGGTVGASGGSSGKGGSKAAGGEGGSGPDEPLVGAIVVAQRIGTGTQAVNHLIVIDPEDGAEVARTETEQQIQSIGYEAARDKWFIFTGTTGAGGPSTVLVGSVTRRGFVQESSTEVTDGKPTGPNTMTVLNERIFYRTVQSDGATTADKMVLLNTANLADDELRIVGSVDFPADSRIFATLGRPNAGVGGRVTFIHFNRANSPVSGCTMGDASAETVCPVRTSSIAIGPNTTNPMLPTVFTHVDYIGQSGSNPSGATDPKNGFDYIVVPPEPGEGSNATAYKYNNQSALQTKVDFDLGTLQAASVSMSATVVDPCIERVITSEQANTRSIYAVPFQGTAGAVDVPLNALTGLLVYEPYTRTVIQYLQDAAMPSFRGFVLGGTAEVPTLTERGTGGALPWMPPTNLNPAIVAVKNPLQPPCN